MALLQLATTLMTSELFMSLRRSGQHRCLGHKGQNPFHSHSWQALATGTLAKNPFDWANFRRLISTHTALADHGASLCSTAASGNVFERLMGWDGLAQIFKFRALRTEKLWRRCGSGMGDRPPSTWVRGVLSATQDLLRPVVYRDPQIEMKQ